MSNFPNIQVVVFDHKGVSPITRQWLRQFKHVEYSTVICGQGCEAKDYILVNRNLAAQWFLEKTDCEHLVMWDEDIRPDIDTTLMLESPADIVSAHVFGTPGWLVHDHPGRVAISACKISRKALQAIERPWFKLIYNGQHTRLVKCECDWFAERARLAGFYPVKAGRVVHEVMVLAVPPDDDSTAFKFLFEKQHMERLAQRIKKDAPAG